MKFCGQCGKQLNDDTRFCGECGNEVMVTEQAKPDVLIDSVDGSKNNETVTNVDEVEKIVFEDQYPIPASFPPRRLKPLIWALAGLVVLLLAGGSAFYLLGNFSSPQTPKLVSTDAEMYVCIKPNFFQVRNFNKMKETYLAIPEVNKAFDQMLNNVFENNNIDFEKDVKSWLGKEAAIAVPSFKNEKVLFIAEQTNQTKAQEFINKSAEKENTHQEAYSGVNIVCNDSDFAAAISGKYLIAASDKALLKETIDRQHGNLKDNLTQSSDYQDVVNNLSGGQSVFCYINMGKVMKNVPQSNDMFKPLVDKVRSLEKIGWAIGFENDGLRTELLVGCDKNDVPASFRLRSSAPKEMKETLKLIPAESLGFVHISNYVDISRDVFNYLDGNLSDGKKTNQEIRSFENQTGINIETDVFNVLRGDSTAAFLPANKNLSADIPIPISCLSVTGIKDQEMAEKTMGKITRYLNNNQMQVSNSVRDGFQYYEINDQKSKLTSGILLMKDSLIMGSPPDIINQVMKQKSTLGDDAIYRRAANTFSQEADPLIYVNVPKVHALVENNLSASEKTKYHEIIYPWLIPVQSISIVYEGYNEKNSILKGSAFICNQK